MIKGFFARQHPQIKWLFTVFFSLIIIIAKPIELLVIAGMLFFYLLVSPRLLGCWLQTLLKLLPLFITIIAFALLFAQDFYSQLYLIGRLALLILLSVYLVRSSEPSYLFAFLPASWVNTRRFLAATFLFIPVFLDKFSHLSGDMHQLQNNVHQAVEDTWLQLDNVRNQLDKADTADNFTFSWLSDIFALILIVISILLYILL